MEEDFESKIEQLQESYKDKMSDLIDTNNSKVDKENLNNIKEMLVSTHGSLPYYQNRMDALKRRIEEVIEQIESL